MSDDPKKPLTPEEAMAKIKEIAKSGKIIFASNERISLYDKEVREIMVAMGMSEKRARRALVSDESSVSDFCSIREDGMSVDQWLSVTSDIIGVNVKLSDRLVDIAKSLRDKTSN